MKTQHFTIAIDGPSGAGKSTVAKILAAKLNILYVDTGALYRTIGLYVFRAGVDPKDADAVVALLPSIQIEVTYQNGKQVVYLNGENPGEEIRRPEISMYASAVSAIPAVRTFLLETQQKTARENSVIMDGRDIGTVILPNADLKVFLVADDTVRAQRRLDELKTKGIETTLDEVLTDMQTRDANDRNRAVAPAVQAPDAVLLNNSSLTIEGTADAIIALMKKKKIKFALNAPKKKNFSRLFNFVYVTLHGIVRFLHRIKVKGSENEPKPEQGPYLLVSNHLSWRDPILLCAAIAWQQPHFMAKKELFAIPGLAALIRSLGAYPVNRGGADVGAVKNTIAMLQGGTCVGMFPQGHRYPGVHPSTTPIKNGVGLVAYRAGVQILPAAIVMKNHKSRFLCRKTVVFGKPISHEELMAHGGAEKDYLKMTQYVFDAVCALQDENHG